MAFQFPIASGKKKPVQVFTCPDETWKVRKTVATKAKGKETQPERSLREEIRQEFDETFDSVKEFAHANLKGKEKKLAEAKRVEALGGKAAKNRNMPYHILMGIKKKAVVREKRQQELNKEADVVLGKRKPGSRSKGEQKQKKKVDYGIQATKGRFKKGVLNVSGL